MSAIKLSSRYAKALIDLAIEKGQLEEVYADILLFKETLKISRDFRLMLKSPIISSDRKEKVIDAIMLGKINKITIEFKKILVRKGREMHIEEICNAFVHMYNEHKHITPVSIRSAVKLSDEAVEKILAKAKLNGDLENVQVTTHVDESLIGGFVLKYGDKQYDASLSEKLNDVRQGFVDDSYIKKLFK